MSEEVKPCPFCGATLMPNNNQDDLYVRRYGTHYQHPQGDCFMGDWEVSPSGIGDWNRRTGVAEHLRAAVLAEREANLRAVGAVAQETRCIEERDMVGKCWNALKRSVAIRGEQK
jgi:hypothetical protein